jgi:hypothetical protein
LVAGKLERPFALLARWANRVFPDFRPFKPRAGQNATLFFTQKER